jgi:replicative DNA helicase
MQHLHSFNVLVKLKSNPQSFEEFCYRIKVVDFTDPDHREIYQNAASCYDRLTKQFVYPFLENMSPKLRSIWDHIKFEPPASKKDIEINCQFLKKEAAISISKKAVVQFLDKIDKDPSNILRHREELLAILPSGFSSEDSWQSGIEARDEMLTQIQEHIDGNEDSTPIPLPFETLNWLTNGGVKRGQLFVIGSTTNFGKSMFCTQLAIGWTAMENLKVCIVGLEMDGPEYMRRVTAQMARVINISGMNLNNLLRPDKYHGINAEYKQIVSNQILEDKIANNYSFLREKIVSKELAKQEFMKAVHVHKADVIILDHLLLLEKNATEKEHEAVHAMTHWMKGFATNNNVVCVAVSQMNRGTDLYDPKTADMAGGRGVENQADLVLTIGLHEEEGEEQQEKNGWFAKKHSLFQDDFIRKIFVLKARNAKRGTSILTHFEGENAGFAELIPDRWKDLQHEPPEGITLTWSKPYKKLLDYIDGEGELTV